jgi:hypothetical protein
MASIVEKIPNMKTPETLQLWRNAVDIASDPMKKAQHRLAADVILAVRAEWERRGRLPIGDEDMFAWPSTAADGGDGSLSTEDWTREGVLKSMGYKVGQVDGRPTNARERILGEIFDGPLPPVFVAGYLAEWGRPRTTRRLRKMAETIAALTRNAKRRKDARMRSAIRDWEHDLGFLYDEYYVGQFHFAWPTSAI